MIVQVVYLSRSTHPMGHESDQAILTAARTRNAEHNLTGFLFRTDHSFLQLLEGEEAHVDAVMALIRQDPRHEIIEEWPKQESEMRAFPDWDMGFGPLDRDDVTEMMDPKASDEVVWASMVSKLQSIAAARG